MGGAQAIAALAYGSGSVPKVDKIFGPGNAYVVAAKRLLFGHVAVDLLPGPSEVLVHVRGEMLTRLDGLVASWGSVTMKPELKRFRGKATDKPAIRRMGVSVMRVHAGPDAG